MAHVPQARLFSWEDVESGSDHDRLSLALDSLPDDALMQALEARRAKGRDDYPGAGDVECGDRPKPIETR